MKIFFPHGRNKDPKAILTINVEDHRLLQRRYKVRVGRPAFVRRVAVLPSQLRHRQFADDDVLALELLEFAVHLLAVHQPVHHRRGFPFAPAKARKATEIIRG